MRNTNHYFQKETAATNKPAEAKTDAAKDAEAEKWLRVDPKAGKVTVPLRILVPRDSDDQIKVPNYYVSQVKHYIKDHTGKTILTLPCRKNLGLSEPCAACDLYHKFKDENDSRASQMGFGHRFVVNVYVMSSPSMAKDVNLAPLQGKVLLMEFGNQIMRMFKTQMSGEKNDFETIAGCNFLDYLEGKTFLYTVFNKGENKNYEESKFQSVKSPMGDEAAIKDIESRVHSLEPYVYSEAYIGSYANMKAKLIKAFNMNQADEKFEESNAGVSDMLEKAEQEVSETAPISTQAKAPVEAASTPSAAPKTQALKKPDDSWFEPS